MTELREIFPEQLKEILEEHQWWIESDGKEGKKAILFRANLQKANLRFANLQEADLCVVNFREANLTVANLQKADLFDANLQEANLSGANLQEADLREANLQQANLSGANLREADLFDANLQEANLSRANLWGANLGTDLTFGIVRDLTAPQVKKAKNWELAFYEKDFLKVLGLPPDHNKTLKKKLADFEKKEKEAATKK